MELTGKQCTDMHLSNKIRGKAVSIIFQVIGGFTSLGDLNGVPGVGQGVLDQNRGRLICCQTKRAYR